MDIQKEKQKLATHRYRSRQAGNQYSLTFQEWETILRSWNYTCYHCGGPYEELEHVIPVSKAGGTTASNCRPVCSYCNSLKGTNTWHVDAKQLRLFP